MLLTKKTIRLISDNLRLRRTIRSHRRDIRGIFEKPGTKMRIKINMDSLSKYVSYMLKSSGIVVVETNPDILISFVKKCKNDALKEEIVDFVKSYEVLDFLAAIIVEGGCFESYYPIWERCNFESNAIKKQLKKDCLHFNQLDFVITQRCSLKCRDCLALMQYYKSPVDFYKQDLFNELDILDEVFDGIQQLHILGGEPFMNKDVYEIIEYASRLEHVRWVVVFTNATIIPDVRINKLDRKKVVFYISNYNCDKQKIQDTYSVLKKEGFACYVQEFLSGWMVHSSFEENNEKESQMNQLFAVCGGRDCPTICEGKIYYCEYLANASMLRAIPESEDNYVELKHDAPEKSRERILSYFACKSAPRGCFNCKRPYNEQKFYENERVTPGVQINKPLEYKKYEI